MLDSLPFELAVLVLQTCGYQFRHVDRLAVISLAQTSNLVYTVISPIMYEHMIVTVNNSARVHRFLHDEDVALLAERVCKHVRNICVTTDVAVSELNPSLLRNVETAQCTISVLEGIAAAQGDHCRLRDVQISHLNFVRGAQRLPLPTATAVTHVFGCFMDDPQDRSYSDFVGNTSRWTHDLIDALPAMTHLGFNLIQMDEINDTGEVKGFDSDAFERLLQVAVQYRRLQVIAFRLVGFYIPLAKELQSKAEALKDSRICFWCDHRYVAAWEDEERWCIEDVRGGRSIWTEAVSVFSSKTEFPS